MFHLEISGKEVNLQHCSKKLAIEETLSRFHFEISAKFLNSEHPNKNPSILVTLSVLKFEISPIVGIDPQSLNIYDKSVISFAFKISILII